MLSLLYGPEIQKALNIQVRTTVSLCHMLTVNIAILSQKVVKGWSLGYRSCEIYLQMVRKGAVKIIQIMEYKWVPKHNNKNETKIRGEL